VNAAATLAVDGAGRGVVLTLPLLLPIALLLWFVLVVRKQPPQQRQRSGLVMMALLLLGILATYVAGRALG
jgi:hypothetical protein